MQMARGSLWPCQVAAHHGPLAARFGYDMRDGEGDSLPLAGIRSAGDIESFRRRPHPMCRFCDNGKLSIVPWRRSELVAEEWLA